jgi:hypothetical protein
MPGGVHELRERAEDLDLETLADNDLYVRRRGDSHPDSRAHLPGRADQRAAQRGAELGCPDAPDADTQVFFLNLVDRFTPSHQRLLTLWDDPPEWFASHGLIPLAAAFIMSRTLTVEAGLPGMKGARRLLPRGRRARIRRHADGEAVGEPSTAAFPATWRRRPG